MTRIDPGDIKAVNGLLTEWAGDREAIRPVAIDELIVAADALDALDGVVDRLAGSRAVLVVQDRTAITRAGEDLKTLVTARLARRRRVATCRLPLEGEGAFHADLETSRRIAVDLGRYGAVVAVGSGSVTDAAKYARHLAANEGAPTAFVCFPTAPSVTAFTSALAVLSVDGVKRTLDSRPPDAVVCDLRTLADAPRSMLAAGFGDVLARSVAYGDWYLAHETGMDDAFSPIPSRLLEDAERRMIACADGVAAGEPAAVRAVLEAVLLAGMAMSVVNATAPISGWEHVISHFLDLTAARDGREPALHGGQVGAATLVSARAYERAWKHLDVDRLGADETPEEVRATDRAIEQLVGGLDSSGALLAEIRRDLEKKRLRRRRTGDRRRAFAARKRAGELDAFIAANVRGSGAVEEALRRAGAPTRCAALDRPVPPHTARQAVRYAHLIRARMTFGDLLAWSGWLTQEAADSLLDAADR